MSLAEAPDDYRLPRGALPLRYDLELAPDLDACTFRGTERIEIEIVGDSPEIVLNADELAVFDASIAPGWASASDLGDAAPLDVTLDQPRERVHFGSSSLLARGRYTLSCSFTGTLNDQLVGFYRSTYVDEAGIEHTIATTEFEETDARRAFPCFDEPDLKAVFGVTLVAPPGTMAVSNGPEIDVEILEGGARRIQFGDTIKMSTYLVAFVVGALEVTPSVDVDGVALRVVHTPGKESLTAPSIEIAAHALRYFAEYFDVPYPGTKLDLVGIPDFASGAMENLGCVIFRETDLLADPDNTSLPELTRIVEVVAHEIAHMWFGDLVTMRWWNGVWLNEAFATFMSMLCQDNYRPQWNVFLAFARSRATGLATDGLSSTRPIEYPVLSPDEASAMFDPPITYYKGGSVLWMIHDFLGADGFREGVRRYLKAHAYANTETSDLWDSLESANPHVPVREVMESWIFQGGYPLISVHAEEGAGGIELREEPFSYLSATDLACRPSNIGSKWLTPVQVSSLQDRSNTQRLVLRSAEQVDLGERPIVVNAGGTGFYRVHYDESLRLPLIANFSMLEPLEQFCLVSDTWAAVQSGAGDVDELLDLVGQLSGATDPYVWSIAIGALRTIDRVAPAAARDGIATFTRRTLRPEFEALGWSRRPDESVHASFFRGLLIGALGTLGNDPEIVETRA